MINKFFFSFIISILPFSKFRKYLYNKILDFKFDEKTYLGFLTILQSQNCKILNSTINSYNFIKSNEIIINDSNIKKFNRIKNLNILSIENSSVGNSNTVYGNRRISEKSNFFISKNCEIDSFNFFDLNDTIKIDNNCKITSHCNFWTHSFDGNRKSMITGSIKILKNVKIEPCVTIINSVTIHNDSIIKFGSIVHKDLKETGIYSSNEIFKK